MYPTTALIVATITTDRRRQADGARLSRATRTQQHPVLRHSRWRRAAALRWPRSPRWVTATIVVLVACALGLVVGVGAARAAFPGTNGKIAFSTLSDFEDFDVSAINPDGSGLVGLTSYRRDDGAPAFSPDGSKISFTSNRDGNPEIYVMNADGIRLPLTGSPLADPDWGVATPGNAPPRPAARAQPAGHHAAGDHDHGRTGRSHQLLRRSSRPPTR